MTQHYATYISTRGQAAPVSFAQAIMNGLAADGGLFIPQDIPDVRSQLAEWRDLDYAALAENIIHLYAGDDLPATTLHQLVQRSYNTFDSKEVTPMVDAGSLHIAELFHGPTLAFKDLALQFLGNLFEYLLDKQDTHLNLVGATSGDTGSAAIHGVRGKPNMNIFVMFPEGRISEIQQRQMTSVTETNVHPLAIEGTFDDTQSLLKSLFNDLDFKQNYHLGAVNSVNWARIVAQIVYYFYSAFRAQKKTGKENVQITVPTGNFGNIFAGYLACRMGAPIERLILATNENNILERFFREGVYQRGQVAPTFSPAMDIQVASNFERYLYYRLGGDTTRVHSAMQQFHETGQLTVPGSESLIVSGKADKADTLATIKTYYQKHGMLLDPHTAVGVHVAEQFVSPNKATVCLATAHPAKFPDAIAKAIGTAAPAYHPTISALADRPTRYAVAAPTKRSIEQYIRSAVGR